MKSISARKFRTSFASLTEPVHVLRRNDAGEFDAVGDWYPADRTAEFAAFGMQTLEGSLPVERIAVSPRPFTPVPKPSQKR